MRVDATGRLGLAVIRHGAPVEGVRPGAAEDTFLYSFNPSSPTSASAACIVQLWGPGCSFWVPVQLVGISQVRPGLRIIF